MSISYGILCRKIRGQKQSLLTFSPFCDVHPLQWRHLGYSIHLRTGILASHFPQIPWRCGMVHRKTVVLMLGLAIASTTACKKRAVTTYHYDNLRTGWNQEEERLTPANVGGPKFGLLHSVVLDDQVDTQPIIERTPAFKLVLPRVQQAAQQNYLADVVGVVIRQ